MRGVQGSAVSPNGRALKKRLQQLREKLTRSDPASMHAALEEVCELGWNVGTELEEVLPDLLAALPHCENRSEEALVYALRHCDLAAVEPLCELISWGSDGVTVRRAARALELIGRTSFQIESVLCDAVKVHASGVRAQLFKTLGLVAAASPTSWECLYQGCSSSALEDRRSALHALGVILNWASPDSPNPDCCDLMQSFVNDPDPVLRKSALYGLRKIQLASHERQSLLCQRVELELDEGVQDWLFDEMKHFVSECEFNSVVPLISQRMLATNSRSTRSAICSLFQTMGASANEAINALRALLRTEDAFYAVRALWFVSRDEELVVPHLMRMYEDYQEEICDLCCEMGASARPLVSKVLNTLSREDWDPQWAAADAIGHIAAGDETLLPAFLELLDHPSPRVRSAIARSIAKIGKPALPVLMGRAQSDSISHRIWAVYSLGEMGSVASSAESVLVANLDSQNAPLASASAIALARINGDPRAIPVLIKVLTDPDDDAPLEAAIEALGAIGPVAAKASQLLDHIATSMQGTAYGSAASSALERIEGRSIQ